jgi:hypothetical protein
MLWLTLPAMKQNSSLESTLRSMVEDVFELQACDIILDCVVSNNTLRIVTTNNSSEDLRAGGVVLHAWMSPIA